MKSNYKLQVLTKRTVINTDASEGNKRRAMLPNALLVATAQNKFPFQRRSNFANFREVARQWHGSVEAGVVRKQNERCNLISLCANEHFPRRFSQTYQTFE